MAISFYEDEDIPLIEKFENKGIKFNYVDVRDRTWIDARRWDSRASRQKKKQTRQIEQEAWKRVKRPKKVKPGYRKRMKREQEEIKRQIANKNRRKKG